LRARQVAEEQVATYEKQERAAVKERELREAQARAQKQTHLTESELQIQVSTNEGKAAYQRSVQDAAKTRTLAEADAERAARIGIAEAIAIEEQVRAYGGPKFQVTREVMNRFADAIASAKVDVVPKVVSGGNGQGNVIESLMGLLLSERLSDDVPAQEPTRRTAPERPEANVMRDQLRMALTSLPKRS
jgi:hypothetical protein